MARPRQTVLSRRRIVEVASALVDAEGLDAVSTRRLAGELGVRGPSLYNHFTSKDEILEAVADAVTATVDVSFFDTHDWRDALRLWAHSYHTVLAAHPHIVPVLARGPNRRPAALAMADTVYGALVRAGWPPARATHIGALMRYLVTGAALGSFARGFVDDPGVYAGHYPHLQHAHLLASHEHSVDEGAFALGLDLCLAGLDWLHTTLTAPPTPSSPHRTETREVDLATDAPVTRAELHIGGAWRAPATADTIDVENPATTGIIGSVPAGTAADVDAAVAAARAAFDGWASAAPAERGAALDRLHTALVARADEIAATIARELGTPLKIATRVQAGLPLTVLRGYADLAVQPAAQETVGNSLVVREPVGVVGAITPWNYPLHQIIAKVAAALAAGCTVVLKPSELTPLVACLLFDAVDEADLPPGVLNLVTGTGPVVGAALAGHADVDMVSFTGSTATGRTISHLAADRIARVALELGGKSASIVLDDADLPRAVKVSVGNALLNSGQTCTAWTRLLVHRSRYDEAVELAGQAAAGYTLGDPFDPATRLGPLVSAAQKERVLGFVTRGIADGARLVTGGPDADVPARGHFVAPTVLADVRPGSELAQEEVFGPVLAVLPFDDDGHAVRIANDSRYGLAGAVWSGDEDRALAVARRLRTGAVDVNGAAFNPLAPFGGYRQSGLGRELGAHGLTEFQQVKAIQR